MATSTRVKVPVSDLITRVEAKRDSEQAEYDKAKAKYDKEIADWTAKAEAAFNKARDEAMDRLAKVTLDETNYTYRYGSSRQQHIMQKEIQINAGVEKRPDAPVEPQPEHHNQVLRLLHATSQPEITVSLNDNLMSYL